MPAFYRMPIVYLFMLVTLAAYPIVSWLTTRSRTSATQASPAAIRVTEAVKSVEPASPRVDDGILRTVDGLRRKVVIRDLAVAPLDKPQGGRPTGRALDYFAILYVRGESGTMLEVGPESGAARGWIPQASCIEWDTRLMARPTPRAGRPPLVLYRESSCLLDDLAGRVCPRHGGRCPTEGEETGQPQRDTDVPTLGFPILATRAIPQPNGTTLSIFEVASLVNDQAPTPTKRQPSPELMRALRRVNVAFVIDTTASMQATIDAARKLASELVDRAKTSKEDVILHMALVEFRDAPPGYAFTSRL